MMKLIFAILLLTTLNANAAVWTASSAWSPSQEQNYQEWVRTNWNIHTFEQPGPLQNLVLDCADAVYSMRLLYAYENRLPFAVKDPSSRRIISNDMKRFDSISNPDQRFRAFALFLYDVLGTESLAGDSYPVAMNRSAIHAGVFIKTAKATHHSWTVQNIDRAGIPFLVFASRPARTKLIDRHYYPTAGFLWGQQDANGNQIDSALQDAGDPAIGAGFRMYRYPEDLLKPEWQVPGYSLEQFQMKKISWARTVQRALQISQESPDEQGSRLLGESCKEATDRIVTVQQALRLQSKRGSNYCFNATEYDDLSTPSKDSRAIGVFKDLVRIYNSNGSSMSASIRAKVEAVVLNRDSGSYCPVSISSGARLTLGDVVNLGLQGRWSSNPNDSLMARWGRERKSAHAASCPVY